MPTKIEWVKNEDGSQGETWNPVTGCTKVSPGCKHCYAERTWVRSLRDQCLATNVPFFMKQMSKKAAIPDDLKIREYPNANT